LELLRFEDSTLAATRRASNICGESDCAEYFSEDSEMVREKLLISIGWSDTIARPKYVESSALQNHQRSRIL
jgi:hypothetical protein